MIDYLQGLLAGRVDGLKIDIWDEKSRVWQAAHLVAVDKTGMAIKGKSEIHFTLWHAVEHVRVKDEAL